MKIISKITTGKHGEKKAALFLKKHGYEIVQHNFRCAIGEIDIIARERGELVFVEVKTRKSNDLGYPEQAVGLKKQKKISQVAAYYLQKNDLTDAHARFDVVAITLGTESEIKLIRNAFDFISSDVIV